MTQWIAYRELIGFFGLAQGERISKTASPDSNWLRAESACPRASGGLPCRTCEAVANCMKHNSPTPMGFIGVGLVWLRFTKCTRGSAESHQGLHDDVGRDALDQDLVVVVFDAIDLLRANEDVPQRFAVGHLADEAGDTHLVFGRQAH